MPKPGKGGGSDSGTISGNKRDNLLTGSDIANIIDGKGGNDTLFGLAGDDTLLGGDGNDRLDGGSGNDSVDGGAGSDTAVLSGNRDDYVVTDLGDGSIQITGPDGTDTYTNVEQFEFADMTQTLAEVVLPRLANLSVDTLNVYDPVLSPGEGTGAYFHLSSNGTIDAAASSFELVVATAPDDSAIIDVLDSQTAAPVVTGDIDTYHVQIPADTLAPGTYWVAVRVDTGNTVAEEDETDNQTGWVQITVDPPITDFQITTSLASNSDLDLGNGGLIWIDYTLENVSNTGSGNYRIVSVLSRDGTVSSDDIELASTTGTLHPGQTSISAHGGLVDSTLAGGDYQVLTYVEWTGGEVETTPADNLSSLPVTLTPAVADFEFVSATLGPNTDLDLSYGGQIEMTYNIVNTGTDTPSTMRIVTYLSTDDQISADDQQILIITGGTYPGAVHSPTTSYHFPDDFPPGDYYLISVVEWADGSPDATPENNVITQQVTFTPPVNDLAITNVAVRDTADLVLDSNGVTISYEINVANLGAVTATSGITAYLSTDGTISADDIQLQSGSFTLNPSSTDLLVMGAVLDSNTVSAGDYQLIVTLDTPDDDAQNNTVQTTVTLEQGAITGTEANDTLTGTSSDDLIQALGGDDLIFVTSGSDVIDGGAGFDTLDFSGETAGVFLQGDAATQPGSIFQYDRDTNTLEQSYHNVEAIIGTDFDDLISLWSTDVHTIDLGAGNDIIEAGNGDNTINGGTGNDLIGSGNGDDVITLGEGSDVFAINRFDSGTMISGSGHDRITDFNVAEDMVFIQISYNTTGYDPLADLVQTAEGALLDYGVNGTLLLEGVDVADLTAANFMVDTSFTPPPDMF